MIGEAPLDFADALRNIDQVAADPRRLVARMVCHWCECAPSRAISSKCSRACLLIRYCANQYLFCWRFQLSAAQAVLSNIYQYRPVRWQFCA